MKTTQSPNRITAVAARAADTTRSMPYVLGTSLVLSAGLMSLAWIIPALYG